MRRRRTGNSFLLLIVVLFVVLCVAMYLLSRKGPSVLGEGIPGLAAAVPADTCFFMGFDLRQSRRFGNALQKLESVSKQPEVAKSLAQFKDEVGFSLQELSEMVEPDGCAVLLPLEGRSGLIPGESNTKPFEAGLLVSLRDEQKTRAAFEQMLKKNQIQANREEVAGEEIFVAGAGPMQWAYSFRQRTLFVASGRSALIRLLDVSGKKQPSLAESPSFKDALARVPVGGASDAVLFYSDIKKSLSGWEKDLAQGQADDMQKAAVDGLEYMALGSWADQSGGYLKVDKASKSKLIQALVTASAVPNGTARYVPVSWGSYTSLNLPYLYSFVMECLRLAPDSRAEVDQFPQTFSSMTGVSLDEIMQALDGELAFTSDTLEILQAKNKPKSGPEISKQNHIECISNLKNVGTALEMYCTDYEGRYPDNLAKLTPNYLKVIPNCPVVGKDTYSGSYQVATSPDAFTVFCQGNNHGVGADYPLYSCYEGIIDPEYESLRGAGRHEEPEPTFLVLLGLKSPDKFKEVFSKLLAHGGPQPMPAAKIGEVEVFQMGTAEYCVATQPTPVALIAFGPNAHKALEKALGTSSQPSQSVAETPVYQAVVKRAGSPWVSLGYQDFGELFRALAGMVAQESSDSSDAETGKLLEDMARDVGEVREASYVSVDADGIKMGGGGISGSMMMLAPVAAAVMVPNFVKARGQGQLTACKSNLKNIATASEMYASDYEGRYPKNLGQLTPNYLRIIPNCPAAQEDTYSAAYQSAASPDRFTVYCSGDHHSQVGTPANYPQYNSEEGLIER